MPNQTRPRPTRRPLLLVATVATFFACAGPPAESTALGPDLTEPRPDTTARQPGTWSFTGATPSPLPFDEAGWDVQIHSRDRDTWLDPQPMAAHHTASCGAPPGTHPISRYDQMVFRCRDHLMTAIRADGYGAIVLTPDRQLDWGGGEAIVRFDLSTFRSSERDWIKVWITPFDVQLPVPAIDHAPDLNGPPSTSLFIEMTSNGNFCPRLVRGFRITALACDDGRPLESRLTTSATVRSTVEIRVSRTRVRVAMPGHDIVFADAAFDAPLTFDRGVVQFAHYSYTPEKCQGCAGANTWHWDEIHLAPSVAFGITRGDRRHVDGAGGEVTFAMPARRNARLRFVAAGVAPEISVDGGTTWQLPVEQAVSRTNDPIRQYWTPVPPGTTRVRLRPGRPITWWPHADVWVARDFALWSVVP
jgi:hypothetical protein